MAGDHPSDRHPRDGAHGVGLQSTDRRGRRSPRAPSESPLQPQGISAVLHAATASLLPGNRLKPQQGVAAVAKWFRVGLTAPAKAVYILAIHGSVVLPSQRFAVLRHHLGFAHQGNTAPHKIGPVGPDSYLLVLLSNIAPPIQTVRQRARFRICGNSLPWQGAGQRQIYCRRRRIVYT